MNHRFICPPLSYTHRLYRYAYPDGIDNDMPFVESTATTVPEQIIEDSPAPNTAVAANALLHKSCDEPLFSTIPQKDCSAVTINASQKTCCDTHALLSYWHFIQGCSVVTSVQNILPSNVVVKKDAAITDKDLGTATATLDNKTPTHKVALQSLWVGNHKGAYRQHYIKKRAYRVDIRAQMPCYKRNVLIHSRLGRYCFAGQRQEPSDGKKNVKKQPSTGWRFLTITIMPERQRLGGCHFL